MTRHITILTTQLTDTDTLIAALTDVGYGQFEVHDQAQPLFGYQGDQRCDSAHVIICREHIGRVSNDIGFHRQPDGRFLAVISEYDRTTHGQAWLGRVTARHVYHATASTLAAQDFHLADETPERDGTVRMVLRRFP